MRVDSPRLSLIFRYTEVQIIESCMRTQGHQAWGLQPKDVNYFNYFSSPIQTYFCTEEWLLTRVPWGDTP